jgi:hypothetical protein
LEIAVAAIAVSAIAVAAIVVAWPLLSLGHCGRLAIAVVPWGFHNADSTMRNPQLAIRSALYNTARDTMLANLFFASRAASQSRAGMKRASSEGISIHHSHRGGSLPRVRSRVCEDNNFLVFEGLSRLRRK